MSQINSNNYKLLSEKFCHDLKKDWNAMALFDLNFKLNKISSWKLGQEEFFKYNLTIWQDVCLIFTFNMENMVKLLLYNAGIFDIFEVSVGEK